LLLAASGCDYEKRTSEWGPERMDELFMKQIPVTTRFSLEDSSTYNFCTAFFLS
jgi:hypothetical protein